ncbi:hypothetical protein MEX01_05100 [Methylorubrum extorquens]|uniref:hypothetical protein n=1 Tax=Methylorubrum extorquens TaxID=408 RepID=UPI00116EC0FE|nr:hypothetical protein [Methylorubrum extorquens]GEL39919.1 hypothetical protein MEX01_05100 [Methylorubrum extorquens]
MLTLHKISPLSAQAATRQSAAAPALSSHACVPAPTNDDALDYLDRELADLPLNFDDVPPALIVANLDGSPAEPEPAPVSVPDPVTRAALRRHQSHLHGALSLANPSRLHRSVAGEAVDHQRTGTTPKPRKRTTDAQIDAGDAPRAVAVSPVPSEPGNDNDAGPGVKKRRSASGRVSLLGDRAFLNDYKALTGISEGIAPVQAGVSSIVGMGRGSAPTDPLPSFMTKAPRPWASATDETKAHFALEALRARGPVVAFTAWTSEEICDRAYERKPLPWLRKRVAEALDAAFGTVELFETIEEEATDRDGARKRRLHLHGALNLENPSRRRLALLRKVLRHAMGPWDDKALKSQVKLKLDPNAGWASYCTKRSWLALPGIRARFACDRPGSPWRLSFDGPVLTMTNGIRAEAQELHQKARKIVREARQRAATLEAPETAPVLPEPPCEPAAIPEPASEADAADRAEPAPAGDATTRPWTADLYIGLAFTAPAMRALDGPFRMPATARSRGPPARVRGPSAGPDPPLAERLLIREIAEDELPALAVAEGDNGRAGHEAGLPRDNGLPVDPRPAGHGDDDRRVRVADRPRSGTPDRAREGDPELPDARVVTRRLPSSSGAIGKLSGDGDGEDGRGLRERSAGEEERQEGERELFHAPPVAAKPGPVTKSQPRRHRSSTGQLTQY